MEYSSEILEQLINLNENILILHNDIKSVFMVILVVYIVDRFFVDTAKSIISNIA